MEAYSLALRRRVLSRCDAGHGTKQVADLFDVSPAWVRRLKQRRRELGIIDRLPRNAGRKPKLTADDLQRLGDLVASHPDATLAELRERLGKSMGLSTLCRALAKVGLSFKKSRSTLPSRTVPTSRPADASGTGANEFNIDFVTILGDASAVNGTNVSQYTNGDSGYKTFSDPSNDYRMGVYEITNQQWEAFKAEIGVAVNLGLSVAASPRHQTDEVLARIVLPDMRDVSVALDCLQA